MPDDPAHPERPRLDYASDVDPGGIYIGRHDGGLTIMVPPASIGRSARPAFGWAIVLLLAFAVWYVTSDRQMTEHWFFRLFVLALVCAFGWVIVYGYHLTHRHVRIDVDERRLRRTARGLFGRREQAWDRRRIAGLHRTHKPTGDDAAWAYLMVRTHDGRQHILLDSSDPDELSVVEDALREALELPVNVNANEPPW